MNRGNLFVISAPSGTGKTTLLKEIMATVSGIAFSVSHTTRKPRTGEKNGEDYHFVDRQAFLDMRAKGAFLEWAEVHGNLYGTSRAEVEKQVNSGIDLILDIDVQGAAQIRKSGQEGALFLFIVPPSWRELEQRLTGRNTDSPDTIALRLNNARQEITSIDQYDYVIVNDSVETAVDTLRAIIVAERCRNRRSAAGLPINLTGLLEHDQPTPAAP